MLEQVENMINSSSHESVEATWFTLKRTQIYIKYHVKNEVARLDKLVESNRSKAQTTFIKRIDEFVSCLNSLTCNLATSRMKLGLKIDRVKAQAVADAIQATKEGAKEAA